MHVVVCAKRVPDSAAKIRPGPDGRSVSTQGVEYAMSPYDEIALERAVQLKEQGKASKVTVLCLGPKAATKELRKALAVGADEALHLLEDRPLRDTAATAGALAQALRDLGADLVLCGWKAIDDDSASVGGYLAELLGFGYASFVVELEPGDGEIGDGEITVRREVEGAVEVLKVPLPCVLTVQKGLAEPRFAKLKEIMKAKRKPLTEAPPADAPNASEILRLTPPPPRPPGRIVGEGADAVPELVRVFREEIHVV